MPWPTSPASSSGGAHLSYGLRDYAASFVNLETGMAFRVISTEESRALASVYAPEIPEKYAQQLEAYKRMPIRSFSRFRKLLSMFATATCPVPPAIR